jgi:hypothetical protein
METGEELRVSSTHAPSPMLSKLGATSIEHPADTIVGFGNEGGCLIGSRQLSWCDQLSDLGSDISEGLFLSV